jgi:pentatricopeptide repeat protein
MPIRNVVSWTSLILGHVNCGQGQKAMEIFQQMQHERVEPDTLTFVGVLNACASVVALEEGRHVHEQIIQTGCNADVFVSNYFDSMGSIFGIPATVEHDDCTVNLIGHAYHRGDAEDLINPIYNQQGCTNLQ